MRILIPIVERIDTCVSIIPPMVIRKDLGLTTTEIIEMKFIEEGWPGFVEMVIGFQSDHHAISDLKTNFVCPDENNNSKDKKEDQRQTLTDQGDAQKAEILSMNAQTTDQRE